MIQANPTPIHALCVYKAPMAAVNAPASIMPSDPILKIPDRSDRVQESPAKARGVVIRIVDTAKSIKKDALKIVSHIKVLTSYQIFLICVSLQAWDLP
jgi:hypothetical protein